MKLQKVDSYKIQSRKENQVQPRTIHSSAINDSAVDSVSFGAAPTKDVVSKSMESMMPPILTGMRKAKDSMGEVQNIIINALGTGLIAPIFIKYNPLSKTDEDTRTYSAWRQPVSAVLAVATQATITIPFNRAIKDMATNGWFGETFNETPYCGNGAEKKFIDNLLNKNTILYNTSKFDKSTQLKEIDPERYKKLLDETLNSLLAKEEAEHNRCNGIKKDLRIARSKYYQANPEASSKLLNEMSEILNSNSSVKEIQKQLKDKIKELKANKADEELIKMAKEVKDRGAALQENWISKFFGLFTKKKAGEATYGDVIIASMKEKVNKMKGFAEMYKGMTAEQAEAKAADSIANRLSEIDHAKNFLNNAKEKLKNGATAADIEALFNKESEINKAFRLKDKKFSTEVLLKFQELTKNNISVFKQISGLIVSCAMLPITCSLLNYLYPIFMDTVFPNLSSKKHTNKSSELVQKATENKEVK